MKCNPDHNTLMVIGIAMAVLFAVCTLAFAREEWLGGTCTDKLHDIDEPLPPDAISYYSGKAYGFPLPFLSIGLEGWCDRQSKVEWHPGMLLLDVAIFAMIGSVFYWVAPRKKRPATG